MSIKFFFACFLSLLYTTLTAQPNGEDTLRMEKLLNMSFEDLMNITVITPSQNLQKSGEAPATVLVITKDQIKLRGYRNLAEVLNDLPDVTINDKSDPQFYNRVSLRGVVRQDFFVILLDGVRISSPTNEPLPLLENFPIYLAKQIEVVFGPGSALYGADAMAGVINIITQEPEDGTHFLATAMGGTHGYSNASATFTRKIKHVKLFFGGQYTFDEQPDFSKIYQDQYDMTSHQTGVFNTSYGPITAQRPVAGGFAAPLKTYNFYSSIERKRFSMKVLHHYAAVPTSTTLKPDNAVYNKDVFYGQGVTTASTNYTVDVGRVKSTSIVVGSFYSVNPKSNYRNLYGGMAHGYKYSNGSMMKVEEQLSCSFSKQLNVIGGITYEIFQSVPKTPELQNPVSKNGVLRGILLNSISPNNPEGIEARFFPLTYRNGGAYLQTQYFPIDKLSFTAGVRYDNNSRFGSTVNPRVGSVFHPFENTTVKALYGTAFWAPSPMVSFESYGSFYTVDSGTTYQAAFWHLPNPDLKPMTSRTFELSLQQRVGKNLNITVTGYTTQIENVIENVSDNGNTNLYNNKFLGWNVSYIEVPINQGTQKNYGGSILANCTFKVGGAEFMAYTSVSYLEGVQSKFESSEGEVEQAGLTPWQFRLGMDGKLRGFHISARLLRAGKQRTAMLRTDDPGTRQTIDGYALLNMSAGYSINSRATFFINVQNTLNQKYLNSLPFYSADTDGSFQNPLRAMAGVRVEF